MSILNFVNQDQLDDLDDDPKIAFMQLVNHAQRSLSEQTKNLDEDERSDWAKIENLRFSFMNVVLASAKRFEIEPFVSMKVPHRKTFDTRDYDQFKFDLDHYVTQLVIDNSRRSKADSVEILPDSRAKIRSYIAALRECIERANIRDEKKREALLKRLSALESELEKRRVNMMSVARVVFEIWAIPGAAWQSYDVANKLLSNLMSSVAEAKATEDEQKGLPAAELPKALSAPRDESMFISDKKTSGGFADDLNDEMPF